jgi:hypothetical protein
LLENSKGKEISWQDFQKQLLESGQVDRIIVANNKHARVVLRQPVEIVSKDTPNSWDISALGINKRNKNSNENDYNHSDSWEHENSNPSENPDHSSSSGWGGVESSSSSTSSSSSDGKSPSPTYRYPRLNRNTEQTYAPYYFNIG